MTANKISSEGLIGLGALMLLIAAFTMFLFVVSGSAAGQVASDSVTINDQELDHVEATVSFNGSETATVTVFDINDAEVTNKSVTGASGETHTLEFHDLPPGDYSLEVTEADTTTTEVDSFTTVVISYNLIHEEVVNVTDSENQTVMIDQKLAAAADGTIEVSENDSGSVVTTYSLTGTDGDLLTRSFDPVNDIEYKVRVTSLNDSASFGETYVTLEDNSTSSTGLLAGWDSSGVDPVAIPLAAALVGIIVYSYKRQEGDW